MNIQTFKYIILYILVFILIIGLTSTFIVKEFLGQAREISIDGEDMLKMQLSLNNANLVNHEEKAVDKEDDDMIIDIPEDKDEDRQVFSMGDANDEIKEYQEALFELGYLKSNPDGSFGPMTEEAVKAFQKEEGLGETGKLDIETQKMLEKKEKKELKEPEEPENSSESEANNKKEHIIRSDDNLSLISNRYNVSVKEICEANNISENTILNIGQKLIIPGN